MILKQAYGETSGEDDGVGKHCSCLLPQPPENYS